MSARLARHERFVAKEGYRMQEETKMLVRTHLRSAVLVLGAALALGVAGMHPAAAAGVAGITVASVDGSSRWRAGRCARKGS